MSTAVQLLYTADEFAHRPDPGYPEELVRGRIVAMPPSQPRHGQVCSKVVRFVGIYAEDHDLGHVLSNDSGVITERGPDTVRGADIAFYSYDRVPRGSIPAGYLAVPPNLVFEVRSPDDRWAAVLSKVAEYLSAGVTVVGVLDPERRTIHLFEGEAPVRIFSEGDELTIPSVLGEFRVPVNRFFD
jgi:Uma2 family endonuclease